MSPQVGTASGSPGLLRARLALLRPGSRRRKTLAFAALGSSALVLVVAGPLGFRRLLSAPVAAVEEIRRGRFVREVEATGTLKATEATPVIVPMDSRRPQKIAWMAPDGARVKAGDPVVIFDPADMQKDLEDGQADSRTAQNKLQKTAAENRASSLSLALDLDLVRAQMTQSESAATKDPSIFSRNEIITSEIDQGLLEKRLQAAEFTRSATSKRGEADVALGQIERSKAEILVRQAQKGLGALRVLAPHDGLLVFERGWRGEALSVGETVFPGQKIAEIPDLTVLEAKVFVLEADAGGLKPGGRARVSLEGRPGQQVAAKVLRVDAMAKTRDWRVPTKYFETILSLDRTDPATMKPGQAVRARIFLEEIAGAIAVPLGAVFEKDGKRIVYRQQGNGFTPTEVSVGHHSLARVVIEKGLDPGDRIALRDPSRSAADILRTERKSETGAAADGGGEDD